MALAADPDTGEVGAVDVTAAGQTVALTTVGASTTVRSGLGPSAAVTLSADDLQRIFGDAIAARAPAPRHLNLYFELGGDTLTPESAALAATVIDEVKGRPAPEVTVVGHTDTTGAAAANLDLGLRRAMLIRDRLIAVGLDPALIEIATHGEADLLVPTPDNTPEPSNRRVEVAIR
ncbi:MAG TPA: OmpA family protein [Vicinamibacterales bacterium]|nr:OmpA family protein [Vicinamibacterales bacterium]